MTGSEAKQFTGVGSLLEAIVKSVLFGHLTLYDIPVWPQKEL